VKLRSIMAIFFVALLTLSVGCVADGGGDGDNNNNTTLPSADAGDSVGDAGGGNECTCEGIECGPNSCGDICGTCTGGLVCDLGACSEPGGNNNNNPDDCSKTGFTAVTQTAEHDPANAPANFFRYLAVDSDAPPATQLQIQSYLDFGGPKTAGTYDLTGSNFEDCGLCVLVNTNCTADGCEKAFLADEGSVNIAEFGAMSGENFKGAFEGIVFKEVTIDAQTFKSKLGPGGETWCMDGYTFDTQIGGGGGNNGGGTPPAGADPAVCGVDNIGTMVGSSIGNFKLQNCNGEWINLHSECGTKAVHIMGTAGWCSACTTTLQQLAGQMGGQITPASVAQLTPGLKMWIVISEDNAGNAPTLDFCKAYAQSKNIDPSMTFIDNNPAGTQIPLVDPEGYAVELNGFATIYSFINPYLVAQGNSVSMGVPWNAVLKGANMEYYWSDYSDPSKYFPQAIQEVVSQ
jgi:hypothetical protein